MIELGSDEFRENDPLDSFPDLDDTSKDLGPSFDDEALMVLYHRLHGREGLTFDTRTGGDKIVFAREGYDSFFFITLQARATDSDMPWFFVSRGPVSVAFAEPSSVPDGYSYLTRAMSRYFSDHAE